jgi:hypothetical protein
VDEALGLEVVQFRLDKTTISAYEEIAKNQRLANAKVAMRLALEKFIAENLHTSFPL